MEITMHRYWSRILVAFAAMFVLHASPAAAQATRTWVSGVGDDVNPCSRTAPCKTFAGAISKTAAGGEISVLDPGGFGAVTITKSITIKADGDLGSIIASGTNGIIINAGANDRVVIDGLEIDGTGTGINGINILSAREVVVRNTVIRNFTTSGITVNAAANQVALSVLNSTIINTTIGVNVTSALGNGSARIWNSYIIGCATAGVRLSVAGNKGEISGNVINRTPKSLDIGAGTSLLSDGTNIVSAGDAPTGVLPRV
jgi:hypothetical protein